MECKGYFIPSFLVSVAKFNLRLGDHAWCRRINYPNEGILLTGILERSKSGHLPLFFARPDLTRSTVNQKDSLFQLSDFTDHSVTLTITDVTCDIPSNILPPFLDHALSVNVTNTKIFDKDVQLSWIQSHIADHAECDIWTLDSVGVSVVHNGHTREIVVLNENFNNETWTVSNGEIFNSSTAACGGRPCALMNRRSDSGCGLPSNRQITTPSLDLRIIRNELGASPTVPNCNDSETIL